MKNEFLIREAHVEDIDFLVEGIINADKGSGNNLSYCSIFDISEPQLCAMVKKIFHEDISGFDFNIRNFMIAEWQGQPVATYSGWVEGLNGIPSSLLKISSFRSFLSQRNIAIYESVAHILNETAIKRDHLTLQLETTYVTQGFRGKGIVALLTNALIGKEKHTNPTVNKVQVQLFKENERAVLTQSKLGFRIIEEKTSDNPAILKYMPGKTRIKMEKSIV